MSGPTRTSIFVIRLMHDSVSGVSGVVERVRTGVKQRFEGKEGLRQLVDEILEKDCASGEEPQS